MPAPNVLLIMADQLTPFALGACGNETVQTPNLDRLAREGLAFDGCYCNSPLCTPSRMSMLTGRYVQNIRTWDNGTALASDVPTIAHHFSAGGYRTCLSGKMHFVGPDQLHGYEERLTTDIYPATPKWTYRWEEEQRHVGRNGPVGLADWQQQHEYDTRSHSRALEWLRMNAGKSLAWVRRHRGKARELPFFLTVSYSLPHPPFLATRDYWDRYEGVEIPLPCWPEGHLQGEHQAVRWIREYHQLTELPSDEEVRAARRAYYANVSFVDDKVGELLACLDRIGQRENTLIVFTSDHGEMLGEHGCWCKRVAYEWSARVPLLLSWPDHLPAARRVGEVTELVHLLPTLCELCGLEPPVNVDGRSMRPLWQTGDIEWRNEALCENYTEGVKAASCMLRADHLKYVAAVGAPPALYDLKRDPGEFTNFAGDPDYADAQRRLAARLAELWDGERIDREIRAGKLDRLKVNAALATGRHPGWAYVPEREARGGWGH
jgi:choline-sulfatase